METAILTDSLVKIYRGKGKERNKPIHALVNLSLEVQIGDIYGFIGPNGAGKTTAIKILMGLTTPTSGNAWITDKPAGSVEAKRQVGYLSEVAYYYPFMEVGKLLDFYCSFYEIKRPERKKKIDDILSLVGLSEKYNAKISELSKGMLQKFGIAQAIIADPPIMILDELTSGLDPIAQKEVKDIVLNLKKRGKTIFFSSHQMTEVEMICDRIGIIHKGVLKKSAVLDDFLKEESGSISLIAFKTESKESPAFLKEKNIQVEEIKSGVFRFLIPDEDINEMLDKLRGEKIDILEVNPHRYTLEDAFFKMIKEEGK